MLKFKQNHAASAAKGSEEYAEQQRAKDKKEDKHGMLAYLKTLQIRKRIWKTIYKGT